MGGEGREDGRVRSKDGEGGEREDGRVGGVKVGEVEE